MLFTGLLISPHPFLKNFFCFESDGVRAAQQTIAMQSWLARSDATGYCVTAGDQAMPMSNAEKQARWRKRHVEQRQRAARIANLLLRRSRSDGDTIEAKVGWNDVTFDKYFSRLASLISDVLKTDKAIKQLRWALHKIVQDRKMYRRDRRWAKRMERKSNPAGSR
jgi:hypothetical protein